MDYIAPRDAANPTDPYIDENPSSGTSGSVVPAAYFNATQGEIVDVIARAGLTPNAALLQLADAIIALIVANAPGGGGTGGVPTTRLISTATGLAGGGSLATDRMLSLDFGALTAAGALDMSEVFPILTAAGHRKTTLSALAAALASAPAAADVFTETVLLGSRAPTHDYTYTLAGLPAVAERIMVDFYVEQTGSYYIQAEIDGAWVTVASATAVSQFGEGSYSVAGRMGLAWNGSVNKLFKLAENGASTIATLGATGVWSGKIRGFGLGYITKIVKHTPAALA